MTPENPTGATVSGFGNVLTQAWIVHDIDQRWAVALGGQPSTLKRNRSENKSRPVRSMGGGLPGRRRFASSSLGLRSAPHEAGWRSEGFELMAIAAWRPRIEPFRHGILNVTRAG